MISQVKSYLSESSQTENTGQSHHVAISQFVAHEACSANIEQKHITPAHCDTWACLARRNRLLTSTKLLTKVYFDPDDSRLCATAEKILRRVCVCLLGPLKKEK